MLKTKTYQIKEIFCDKCNEPISSCEKCKKKLKSSLYCDNDFHYCINCGGKYENKSS